ncbi:MAG: hypothetical protein DRP59_02755 [Spirochaetes bacterium]|nr:MAG: hypothetical protein DRP59_02755 [Spirochaetota bacterium]
MFFLNFLKNSENKSPIEPIVLFLVFFLPGFLFQNQQIDGEIFNSPRFNLYYLVSVVPQILLLLYIIRLKGKNSFSRYGIHKLTAKDIGFGFLYALGVLIILSITMIIFNNAAAEALPLVDWQINNPAVLPLVFLTTITIGYNEELFFRSYLLTEFINNDETNNTAVITAVSLLFALGHIYQGVGGFISTFMIGVFFSLIFLKKRRVHSIAIGHGLYNFFVLIISIFMN